MGSSGGAAAGLFGNKPTTGLTPTSLFGQPNPNTTATTPNNGRLFGGVGSNTNTSMQPTPGAVGLFAGSTQPTSMMGASFGTGTAWGAQPKLGLFGSTTQPQQQQGGFQLASSTPPQQASTSSLNKMTKFNDLPENVRAVIEGMDSFVRQQVHLSEQLKRRELGVEIEKTRNEWQQCSADATAISSLLLHSSNSVSAVRNRLDQDAQDVEKATWIVEGFKNPQGPKAQQAKAVQTFPFEFFRNKTDEFDARLKNYKETIEVGFSSRRGLRSFNTNRYDHIPQQIQQYLSSPSSLSSSIDPSSIVPTLKSQTTSFLALASNVASLQSDLHRLKDEYRLIWRDRTGRVTDPFREREGGREVAGVVSGLGRVEIR
ncbi:BZ3500_MvSof-1268-A1-R1_Chr5-1g07592 [Microbotryum saponariae]|uniref:BZ3500_MvSof-1268-A1-R1_Chr5-1g07592 protein n=1 Tax=Microbotryum saponariae TaxID=289078 RepID=A0A2X0M0V8_9BASI|nr:BZ3500_MvSof-1268-A1-R1_Chr5-1g07592 [Microbotryum saponariae]SDA05463.1 BZ3501_MvSof-1269-A2-R1_Chr5-2g07416 [Microbotryum saponariae]